MKYTLKRVEHGGNKRCSSAIKRAFMWVRTELPDGKELTCLYVYEPGSGWIWENGWSENSLDVVLERAWQGASIRSEEIFSEYFNKLLNALYGSYFGVIEISL